MLKKSLLSFILVILFLNSYSQYKFGVYSGFGISGNQQNKLIRKGGYQNFQGGSEINTIHFAYTIGAVCETKLNETYKLITSVDYMPKTVRYWLYNKSHYTDLTYHYLQLSLLLKKEKNKLFFYEIGIVNNFMIKKPDSLQLHKVDLWNIGHQFYNVGFHYGWGIKPLKNLEITLSGEYDLTPYCNVTETYNPSHYNFRFFNFDIALRYYLFEKQKKE
jgi:hypothetical protein